MKLEDLKKGDKIHIRKYISEDDFFKLAVKYYPDNDKTFFVDDGWFREMKKLSGEEVRVSYIDRMFCFDGISRPTIVIENSNFFLLPGFVAELNSRQIMLFEDEL